MGRSEAALQGERRDYNEPLRWDPDQGVYHSQGVRLVSFSSPDKGLEQKINEAIARGIANPLGEDLAGMEITEEQMREQMIADGRLSPNDERKVLYHR